MNYELTIIIGEKTTEKDLPGITKQIKKIISDKEAKIILEQSLGRKKLTHLIDNNQFGTYLVFQFMTEKDKIKPITNGIKSISEVVRFMITKIAAPKKEKEIRKTKSIMISKKVIKRTKPELKKQKTGKKLIKKITKKEIKKAKPKITNEIESEDERMEKLEEELGKILKE